MTLAPRRSARVALALLATIALAASMWGGAASARTRTVRKFAVSMTPCTLPNTVTRLSATFTNDGASTSNLGSIYLDTSEFWFTGIMPDSAFEVSSGWTGHLESAFGFASDRSDYDGLYLTADSSATALAPGASVTVSFPVSVGSSTGNKLWLAYGWTGTTPYTGSLFSLAATKVNVTTSCVGAPSKVVFTTQPPASQAATAPFSVAAQIQDDNGNPITSGGTQISLNLDQNGNTGVLSPSSSPTATTANGTGIATFSGLSVDKVGTGYTLTASADGLMSATSNAFDIVPGAPAHVVFVNQPTDTLVNQTISPPGVTCTVTDAGNNDVPSTPVTLSIDPSSPAAGAGITGNSANTNSSGVARFDNLSINTTSSGYVLDADASGVKSNPNSDSFNITNTDSGCTDCTATFPGGGTVSAPPGTTLIIENNDTSGCADSIVSPIAGTVTVIPTGSGDKLITFDDPAGNPSTETEPYPQLNKFYPVCKSIGDPPTGTLTLDYSNAGQRCSATDPAAPCIENQYFQVGNLHLITKILITNTDPSLRH